MAYPSGQVIFRTVIGVSILTVLFFVARPVYWKFSAALTDMKASSGSTAGEVSRLEATKLESKEVEPIEKSAEGDALEEDPVSDAVSKDTDSDTETETNTNIEAEAESDPNSDPNSITEKITEGGDTGSETEEGTEGTEGTELKDNVEKLIEEDEKPDSSTDADN